MRKITLVLLTTIFCNYVTAQVVNIPDANFKAALLNPNLGIDTNNNGDIEQNEALATTAIGVSNRNISSLEGIEAFTNITFLHVGQNNLTTLDLSNNTKIEILVAYTNPLTSLDLGFNFFLLDLNVNKTDLTSLDIRNCPALTKLSCSYTLLTSLDLSENINLINYRGYSNTSLNTLDFSNNPNLEFIDCFAAGTNILNVSNCTNLISIKFSGNDLNTIDLSDCVSLEYLDISKNNISSLDVSNNPILKGLAYSENPLPNYDVSNIPTLESLSCRATETTTLDLSTNNKLQFLDCSRNNLTEINLNNLIELDFLYFTDNNITEIDLSALTKLETLNCSNNSGLENLDLSNNPNLVKLLCSSIGISGLDLSANLALEYLNCEDNEMLLPDLSLNTVLEYYDCSSNGAFVLDLSNNPNLRTLKFDDSIIYEVYLKNGSALNSLSFSNTAVYYICVDDEELEQVQDKVNGYGLSEICNVNSYCSFAPGGDYYEVVGNTYFDANNDGCDPSTDITLPYLNLSISDGTTSGTYIASELGEFDIRLDAGMHTITPQFENAAYFNVSPATLSVDFPADGTSVLQNFCVTPNTSIYNDLEIVIFPKNQAVPGFVTEYQVFYKNKGNTTLSGTVALQYDDTIFDFTFASPMTDNQSVGILNWNFTDIEPFQSGVIDLDLTLNPPTDPNFPVNSGDIVSLTATINPIGGDETPTDNESFLNQTVINSFDPNDKTCLEGDRVGLNTIGTYVTYRIRFENNGSGNAINVVIKDVIDSTSFDISSLVPLTSSHKFITRINNLNEVEFIFENINLPLDDANNDGYIVFKVKTLSTLEENDTFENDASIYFDFNFPIITNTSVTTIDSSLSISDYTDASINIYPNPVKSNLTITADHSIKSVHILDINGRLLKSIQLIGNSLETTIDLNSMQSGIYLVEVLSTKGKLTSKIIKE